MEYYKRKLPHWQISGAEYFVTFRLPNSLPVHLIKELQSSQRKQLKMLSHHKDENLDFQKRKLQSKIFKKYEELLDNETIGPTWLKDLDIAEIIKESLHFRDGKEYDLYAYCIMSNHVHVIFRHLEKENSKNSNKKLSPITRILKNLKSFTGLQANRKLKRTGAFWQEENYDHLIRNNSELENMIRYTLNNPVKIKIVENWRDWPNSYCKPEFREGL